MSKKISVGGAAEFNKRFNVATIYPDKIRAGLASLKAEGPESWQVEEDFATRCGVPRNQIGRFRADFADYIVNVRERSTIQCHPRIVWCGDKAVAERYRQELANG